MSHNAKLKLLLILIVPTLVFFLYDFEAKYADRFYPGVMLAGHPVGGQTYEEVAARLEDEVRTLEGTGLTVNFSRGASLHEVNIPMAATGLTADNVFEYFSIGDWKASVLRAYQFGRRGSIFQRAGEQLRLAAGKRFDLPTTSYEESLQSLIAHELENFLRAPVPAQFAVDKKGKVTISEEKNGEILDEEKVLEAVKDKIYSLDSTPVTFQVESEAPLATREKMEPFLKLAQELSKGTNLFFHYRGRKWKVTGPKLATWLTVKNSDQLGIDSTKLKSFLSKTVVPVIDNPPQNSRFDIQEGALVEIFPGRSGNVVDVIKTAEKVEQMIPDVDKSFAMTGNLAGALAAMTEANFNAKTGAINVPVEVVEKDPEITQETIDKFNIKDLVGSTRTNFKGSSDDRINNITIGVSKLNGRLIAPGEEFSAVAAIGKITEEDGYLKEYVIKDNRSIKQLGGGLCQLGTTLFRLGLSAGLPITERVPHSYVVRYYGPGLDATIYGPHPDLRFVNDTGNYLLMQGRVEGAEVVLELYGQSDGRQVDISEPVITDRMPASPTKYISTPDLPLGVQECSETPREGMTTDVTYRVALLNGDTREQVFHSVYQPWGTICLTGLMR